MSFSLPKIRIPSWLKLLAKLAISVVIIVLIVRKIDERILIEVIREAHPAWVLWAVGWFAISKWISALRFNAFLRSDQLHLGTWENIRLYWLCMYYNLLLPGGISGDGYKIKWLMDRFGKSFKRLFTLTLADRISGLIALGQLGLILLFFVSGLHAYRYFIMPAVLISFMIAWGLFRSFIGKHLHVWLKTSSQSLGVQLSQSLATLGLIWALGQGASWSDYLILFLVSSAVAMIPMTIGGAGARELTFLYGAQFLHVHAEKAVAIGFMFYLVSTSVALGGVVFSFNRQNPTEE